MHLLAAVKSSNMKRFLLFFGNVYYPSGGMEDLLSDHDTLEEALSAFDEKLKLELLDKFYENKDELMRYRWANIYDTELRSEVWSS